MKFLYTTLAASLLAFSLIACDDDDDNDTDDGGVNTDATADASTADASTSDASTSDASTSDGSTTDAGTTDGSTTDTDGSTTDTDGSTTDTDGSTTDTDGSTTDTDGSTTDTDGSTTDGGTITDVPANDLCKDATELALGQTVTGSTVKANGEIDEDSLDVYYKVNIATEGYYRFDLKPASKGVDVRIELWKSCAPLEDGEDYEEHSDYITDARNDDDDGEPATLIKQLAAGTYIVRAEVIDWGMDQTRLKEIEPVAGAEFTLSFNSYTPTKPEITSVKASIQLRSQSTPASEADILSLRISGKDAGKDIAGVNFELLNASNEVIGLSNATDWLRLWPKYDAEGVFTDAFAGHYEAAADLASATQIRVWLEDDAEAESDEKVVSIENDFSKVERAVGETCDFDAIVTLCTSSICDIDDDNAAVCQASVDPSL